MPPAEGDLGTRGNAAGILGYCVEWVGTTVANNVIAGDIGDGAVVRREPIRAKRVFVTFSSPPLSVVWGARTSSNYGGPEIGR